MSEEIPKTPSKFLTVLWWTALPIVLTIALAAAGMSGWVYSRCDFTDWAAILQVLIYAFVLGRFAAEICRILGIRSELFAMFLGALVGATAEYGYWFWLVHRLSPETWVYEPQALYADAQTYVSGLVSSFCGIRLSGFPIRLWYYAEAAFIVLASMFVSLGRQLDQTEPDQ